MFKGFIFDVEGTLVDCVPQTLKSLQEALEQFGHHVPYNTLQLNGVRDVFRSLIEQGGRIALATDCKGPALKHYLSLLNVEEFISATACGDDVEHGKPDPRLVGMALRKLNLPGPQAVMVGDTPYDAEAAVEAGASAAGVLTGGFSREALLEAGCFAVADDLLALLSGLERGEPVATSTS
jgi:phosphoglycolate phosphatase-like HAD superfamily hydrolase